MDFKELAAIAFSKWLTFNIIPFDADKNPFVEVYTEQEYVEQRAEDLIAQSSKHPVYVVPIAGPPPSPSLTSRFLLMTWVVEWQNQDNVTCFTPLITILEEDTQETLYQLAVYTKGDAANKETCYITTTENGETQPWPAP